LVIITNIRIAVLVYTVNLILCLDPIQVQMPALSPTMVEGTITKWLIAEGIYLLIIYIVCFAVMTSGIL